MGTLHTLNVHFWIIDFENLQQVIMMMSIQALFLLGSMRMGLLFIIIRIDREKRMDARTIGHHYYVLLLLLLFM